MKTLILAAGMGTRMLSKYPKVTHKVCGKPMINWVIDAAKVVSEEIAVVLGHGAEQVKPLIPDQVRVFFQRQQLGTAHAVMSALDFVRNAETLLILYGDMPLINPETLQKVARCHSEGNHDATIVSADLVDPTGYGRIVRNDKGEFVKIVEEQDAQEEKSIKEVNTGVYIFNTRKLLEALPKVKPNNKKNEYYLTDVVGFMNKVFVFKATNSEEFLGINNRVQLSQAEGIKRKQILEKLMLSGVTIIDPATTYVEADVVIGMDTVIYPMTIIEGNTTIGEDCVIGPMTRLVNCKVGNRVAVLRSECVGATIHDDVSIGPFSRLREGAVLHQNVKIGNFVEVKNSVIGFGTKAQHLSYLGDATIGKEVNIGAGTITCNFDGKKKNPTHIEDEAFIGSNSCLVAPVTIKKGAFVAAGSVITQDVPEWSLGIARARQENKLGWVLQKFQKKEE